MKLQMFYVVTKKVVNRIMDNTYFYMKIIEKKQMVLYNIKHHKNSMNTYFLSKTCDKGGLNMAYNFKEVEHKWQKKWEEEGTFNAKNDYFSIYQQKKSQGTKKFG